MPSFISWVPTPEEDIDTFFQLAPVSPSDVIYDLGCGDGRLLFVAIEKGAGKAFGIDIDPERIRECNEIAKNKGVEDKVSFIESDVMDANLSDATLIFCYLITAASAALKPKFAAELKNGTRIVMESFPVPGWKPVKTKNFGYKTFYLYQMPPVIAD
jgi:ribosomal protein L11 methylase PrmA